MYLILDKVFMYCRDTAFDFKKCVLSTIVCCTITLLDFLFLLKRMTFRLWLNSNQYSFKTDFKYDSFNCICKNNCEIITYKKLPYMSH